MGFAKAKLLISQRSRNYCLFDAVAVRLFFSVDFTAATTEAMQKPVVETIEKGTPPTAGSAAAGSQCLGVPLRIYSIFEC